MCIDIDKKTFDDWLKNRINMLNLGYKFYYIFVTEDSRKVLRLKTKDKYEVYEFGDGSRCTITMNIAQSEKDFFNNGYDCHLFRVHP